jgi:DNA polymerase III delta prime subunit
MFEDVFPAQLNHSYIIQGDPVTAPEELKNFLISRNIFATENPDILFELYEALDMEEGHKIKEWHSLASYGGNVRACIVGAKFINREAEQSLLKILEEPGERTHFFIIVPDVENVLPTIRSRCHIVYLDKDNKYESWAKKFVGSSIKDRIDMVALILKSTEDADTSATIRFEAKSILDSLEKNLFLEFKKDINNKNIEWVLGEIIKAKKYLRNPGSSVKMLLEHIALVI